jgi:hypothetical protein
MRRRRRKKKEEEEEETEATETGVWSIGIHIPR